MTNQTIPLVLPAREAISGMDPFSGLTLRDIRLVSTPEDARNALDDLFRHQFLGFDTESRPTFRKGQQSEGPHILQFSTMDRAYIFQTCLAHSLPAVAQIIESKNIEKVGFGLNDDIKRIAGKLQIQPNAIVDLDHTFKKLAGQKNSVGVKTAIALLFNKRLIKSHKATTSNWANQELTEKQLLYAANDAYAAIAVYSALKKSGLAIA